MKLCLLILLMDLTRGVTVAKIWLSQSIKFLKSCKKLLCLSIKVLSKSCRLFLSVGGTSFSQKLLARKTIFSVIKFWLPAKVSKDSWMSICKQQQRKKSLIICGLSMQKIKREKKMRPIFFSRKPQLRERERNFQRAFYNGTFFLKEAASRHEISRSSGIVLFICHAIHLGQC